MEPAAGAVTDTRDSRPLQDGIKDLSVLHPVTVTVLATPRPCNDYSCYGALEIVGAITIITIIHPQSGYMASCQSSAG